MPAGLLRYLDEVKGRAWLQSRGLQLPKEATKRGNPNLATQADVVNSGTKMRPLDKGEAGAVDLSGAGARS
ncbi:MAG: hypothetical protein WCP68_17325 [Enhydrobacter sp.]